MQNGFEVKLKHTILVFFILVTPLANSAAAQAQIAPEAQPSPNPQPGAIFDEGRTQKPPIDSSVFHKWPSVGSVDISNDGKYAIYTVENQPPGSQTMVIQAAASTWKIETVGTGDAAFTQDSRTAIFIKPKNRLCLLTLGTSSVAEIAGVSAFKLVKRKVGELLTYQRGPGKELVVRDLATGRQQSFGSVDEYVFSSDGNRLLIKTVSKSDGSVTQRLKWINLADGKMTTIWQGAKASGFVFNGSNTQLAFTAEDKIDNPPEKSLWYYNAGTDKAVPLANNQAVGIDSDLRIEAVSGLGFSKDGKRVFITLKEKDFATPKTDAVKVDIWSYTDPKLQSQQLRELAPFPPGYGSGGGPQSYTALIDIDSRRIIRLEQENERIQVLQGKKDGIALITNIGKGNRNEWNWNRTSQSSYYLVSTEDGNRTRIDVGSRPMAGALSRNGKYVIYMDDLRRNMFSYEVETGVKRNLTRNLPIPLIDTEYDANGLPPPRGISAAGWLDDDAGLLIYDKYDIWLLDPAGKNPPISVTNGYGRRHNIVFQLAGNYYGARTITIGAKLILSAFSKSTKDNGFYNKVLGEKGDPELLTMGPYIYDVKIPPLYLPFSPLKARDAEIYVVQRQSAAQSRNYFLTADFKSFTALSDVHPESNYNWLTAELLTWKAFDGRLAQGVLYKPENFDPKRKYPVIIHYYEKKSDGMNKYHTPEPIANDLEIPWFVSHGYLVFTPDIHYTIGHPGRSAYNYVVSGAQSLAKFPWVNTKKIGIQGHSWGGFETNYLITQTNIFAAAMSSSGISDFVSDYGSITYEHERAGKQYFYEISQSLIGATLWQRPDLYIENSPIFRADKVTTPLLMMMNQGDGIVPFSQGVEFFTALRRLGKTAWMLQYDPPEHHSLSSDVAKRDLTIRITQFFDHYLKGAPPPKWMTEGVPARLKGIETGLELDTSGRLPGPGLVQEMPW